MKQVLLLIDFSNASKNAITYALQFLEEEDCKFYLLYVNDTNNYTSDDLMTSSNKSLYSSLISSNKLKLKELSDYFEKKFQNKKHKFSEIADYDSLLDSIKQVVESKSIELIVMGSNGASDTKEKVFGTNTLNVVRHIKRSTLVIPEYFKYSNPKNTLIPFESDELMYTDIVQDNLSNSKLQNSTIHILNLSSAKESNSLNHDNVLSNKLLTGLNIKYQIVNDVPMHYAVSSYIQTHDIDFIILQMKEEFFLERWITGSSSTKISREPIIPLLIIH